VILIVGGSGALGSAVAMQALSAGQPVRIMTRAPARAAGLCEAGAAFVRGDLLDRSSLERACDGATFVVAAAHSLFGRGRNASVHVDRLGHTHLIDAARAAGVRRFVFTSVYDSGPAWRAVPFVRIKQEVEDYLASSGIEFTVLRPTAFMEAHAHLLIGVPILTQRKVLLFGQGQNPRNFVAAEDVARFALLALRDPALAGATIDIGGPDNLTLMDVVRLYEGLTGQRARITRIPLAVPRMAYPVLRPLHPGISQVLQLAVVAETTDQSFDVLPLQQRFGLRLTRLEDWARHRIPSRPAPV
jgi:uncharacterized protein YbjT (DUF2867 family)